MSVHSIIIKSFADNGISSLVFDINELIEILPEIIGQTIEKVKS